MPRELWADSSAWVAPNVLGQWCAVLSDEHRGVRLTRFAPSTLAGKDRSSPILLPATLASCCQKPRARQSIMGLIGQWSSAHPKPANMASWHSCLRKHTRLADGNRIIG